MPDDITRGLIREYIKSLSEAERTELFADDDTPPPATPVRGLAQGRELFKNNGRRAIETEGAPRDDYGIEVVKH